MGRFDYLFDEDQRDPIQFFGHRYPSKIEPTNDVGFGSYLPSSGDPWDVSPTSPPVQTVPWMRGQPWSSPAPEPPPPQRSQAPASRANYMDMLSGMDTSPYDLTPQRSQPAPFMQAPQAQATQPTLPTDLGFSGTRNNPWQGIFAPDIQGGATQPRNDPWKKTFPTPENFMEPSSGPNTQYMLDSSKEKQERAFPLLDKFAALAWNKPQPEDYQGGKGNRIMAMLAGGMTGLTKGAGAGIAAAQQIRQAPYMNAMEQWKEQLAAGKDAATLERYQAENLRKQEYGDSRIRIYDDKLRNDYLLTKARMEASGWRFKENTTTGVVTAFNLINGEERDFGKVGASAEEIARAAGMKETALENVRQPGRMSLAEYNQGRQDVRQQRGFGNAASLQSNLFAHQDEAAARAAANAATARQENFDFGVLRDRLRSQLPKNIGENSVNEAINRVFITDNERFRFFFPGGKFDEQKAAENPQSWEYFKNEILGQVPKGAPLK